MPRVTLPQAKAAKRVALDRLKGFSSVVGVGLTKEDGEYALKINLSQPDEPGLRLPAEIDGVSVHVEVVGPIRAR